MDISVFYCQSRRKMKGSNRGPQGGCVHAQIHKKWEMSVQGEKSLCARREGRSLSQDGTNKGSQETGRAKVNGIAESSSAAAAAGSRGWRSGGRGPNRRGTGGGSKGPRSGGGGGRNWGRGDRGARRGQRGARNCGGSTRGKADRGRSRAVGGRYQEMCLSMCQFYQKNKIGLTASEDRERSGLRSSSGGVAKQ